MRARAQKRREEREEKNNREQTNIKVERPFVKS